MDTRCGHDVNDPLVPVPSPRWLGLALACPPSLGVRSVCWGCVCLCLWGGSLRVPLLPISSPPSAASAAPRPWGVCG